MGNQQRDKRAMARMLSAVGHVWKVRPFYAFVAAGIAGAGLLPLSIVTGVASVMDTTGDTPRQVGYLNAFNWSVVYGLIFPLFVLTLFSFLAEVRRLIRRLGRLGMLVDPQGTPVAGEPLQASWERLFPRCAAATVVLAVVVFPIIMRDWFHTNFVPLYVHGHLDTMRAAMPRLPLDWSTAALFAEDVTPFSNALFSFFAYAVQALAIVVFAHLVVFCIAFGSFLERHSRGDAPTRIAPNPGLLDDRMGLGSFQRVINYLLLMFTAVFGVMYAVRLWQQYLRSDAPSALAFIRSELSRGLWPETLNELPGVVPNYLYAGAPESYPQTATLVLALSSAVVSIAFVLMMMQLAVHRGRRFMLRRLAEESPFVQETLPGTAAERMRRLATLADWPLEKPTRNQTLSFMLVLLLVLVWYRLALVVLAALLVVLLRQAMGFLDGYAREKS